MCDYQRVLRIAQIRGITLFWYVPILIAFINFPNPHYWTDPKTIHLAELEYNYQYTNSLTWKHMKIAVIIIIILTYYILTIIPVTSLPEVMMEFIQLGCPVRILTGLPKPQRKPKMCIRCLVRFIKVRMGQLVNWSCWTLGSQDFYFLMDK